MSYSVHTPCFDCERRKEGCADGVVVTGAIQGIIHQLPPTAHRGAGSVELKCFNKVVQEPAQ